MEDKKKLTDEELAARRFVATESDVTIKKATKPQSKKAKTQPKLKE